MDAELQKDRVRSIAAFGVSGAGALVSALRKLWQRDGIFLLAICAMNVFFVRRIFRDGVGADNDSVAHYAYLRYFVEEFYPKTHTFLGWCPKYNLGLPFLLFNTPPLLYLVTGFTSLVTGLSPLLSLKLWMVAFFMAVPLLSYALVRTFEGGQDGGEAGDMPKYAALVASLISSELFGLELFFKNGMLNPAMAIPFVLGALVCFRHALLAEAPRAYRWIAATAVMLTLTLLTHTLSAYMLGIALAGFTIGTPPKRWGANVLKAAASIGGGLLLAAFWLVPSLPFAATSDAAHTWLRSPEWTLDLLLDGSLITSFPVAFFPRLIAFSHAGIVVNVAIVFGAYTAIRRRNYAFGACALVFAMAVGIALGPTWAWPMAIAPMYERLLWYRFLTLAFLMCVPMAAYGLAHLARATAKHAPYNVALLLALGVWGFYVMTTRAVMVKTSAAYAAVDANVTEIAEYLEANGDKRGRIFSEFLNASTNEPPSVNYARQLLPIMTGMGEVAGWVYENNPASQILQKEGVFWVSPIPMIDLARRLNVKYIVAGSGNFVRALSMDPRWREVKETSDLVLFEARDWTPGLAESETAAAYDIEVAKDEYVEGGGYHYAFAIHRKSNDAKSIVVKTNYNPYWSATFGGQPVALSQTEDGLIRATLPADASEGTLDLRWDIGHLRAKGNRLSLLGVMLLVALVGASRLPARWLAWVPPALVQGLGIAGALGALGACGWRARKIDVSQIGFGIAGGMTPVSTYERVEVGRFDDAIDLRPIHVDAAAWGPRRLDDGAPARTLLHPEQTAAVILVSPRGDNRVRFEGSIEGGAREIEVALADERGAPLCTFHTALGDDTQIPADCIDSHPLTAPGEPRLVKLTAGAPLTLRALRVQNGIRYVEAESFRNTFRDGGLDAYGASGPADYFPQNGITMTGGAGWMADVVLENEATIGAGAYEAWALVRIVPAQFQRTRGSFALDVDGKTVGTLREEPNALPFWDSVPRFAWRKVGRVRAPENGDAKRALRVTFAIPQGAVLGLFDFDALAFVPL